MSFWCLFVYQRQCLRAKVYFEVHVHMFILLISSLLFLLIYCNLLEVGKNTDFSYYNYGPTLSDLFVQMTIETQ